MKQKSIQPPAILYIRNIEQNYKYSFLFLSKATAYPLKSQILKLDQTYIRTRVINISVLSIVVMIGVCFGVEGEVRRLWCELWFGGGGDRLWALVEVATTDLWWWWWIIEYRGSEREMFEKRSKREGGEVIDLCVV